MCRTAEGTQLVNIVMYVRPDTTAYQQMTHTSTVSHVTAL